MGYDRKEVDNLPSYDEDDEEQYTSAEEIYDEDPADPSQRKIRLVEAYWLVDTDDDGISERRLVHYAGKKFLQNEEVERVRLISLTPFPLANKHLGRSMFDKVRQIMDIKTALWRQIIDNLFLINNSRHAVVEGQVRISDILNSRPGGVVRQKQPGMIEPLKTPPIGGEVFHFLEYLDKARDERTGVGPEMVSELGQLANTTAWGVERLMSKKEELVGLVIAIFRSTGVNELFEQMHEILRENVTEPLNIPVDGAWMQANPAQWPKRTTVPSVTWSGMGDRIEKQKGISSVMQWQDRAAADPRTAWMVTAKHKYEAMSDYVRTIGIGGLNQYALDPLSEDGKKAMQNHMQMMEQQAQQEDPQLKALTQMENIKGQYRTQIEQLKETNKREIEAIKERQKYSQEQQDYKTHLDELQFKYDKLEQDFVDSMTKLELEYSQQLPQGLA
jgi:gas vesicle protein